MRWSIALAILAAATSAAAKPARVEYNNTAMGTNVTFIAWTDDEPAAAKAAEAVFKEMKRLDAVMTTWTDTSEVSQINNNAGVKPVKVSDETFEVIERAVDVSKRSGGVFDITVGAFKGLWKFDQDMDGSLPDPKDVKARLQLIGWKNIVLDKKARTVFLKKKGMSITLGGIAKGYAVDKCVAIVRATGVKDFMVQAGGDMYVEGVGGDKETGARRPWQVAIRDPRGPANTYFAVAPIKDRSFSTSGDYERGFVKDGVRYHHILDPRDGQPARATRSVTIRAKDAFTADAWSKVMFIYGWKRGMEIIKEQKLADFDAVWVADDNSVHATPSIEKDLHKLKDPTPGP
jgi:thiamine biosynthesis lipoprotein